MNKRTMNNHSHPQVAEQLREYLQAIVAVRKQSKRETSKYSGFQELILDCGQFMEPKPLPKNIKRGRPRSCYYNCQQLAFKDSNLTYVEGFAIAADVSFPLAHAWLLSPDGYALDPTWEPSGNCYLGIPFSTQWVQSVVKLRVQQGHNDIISIFEGNYLEDFSLLKDGIPPNALIGKV